MPSISHKRTTRIVIVGGGFGGAYCAQALEKAVQAEDAEIVLIDRNNYFVFFPLLIEAGTGSLQPRHAVVPIRSFLRRTTFHMAELIGADLASQEVSYRVVGTEEVSTLAYDHLVVALGSVNRTPPIPGLVEFGYGIKNLSDAVALRDRAIQLLEQADATADPHRRRALLHLVVVGGSFTGAEVAGEFFAFLREASAHYPHVAADECNVTLIEIADRILPALTPELSTYAKETLERRGAKVRLGVSVREIAPGSVALDNGEVLVTHTVVWCAGIAPPPVLERLRVPVNGLGYIVCDDDLRVEGFVNVWAIGDCAVNRDPEGKPYPATAQHAVRQGKHLAENLARVQRGKTAAPFAYTDRGTLAALGCRTGVAKVFGLKFSGFPAWFLWRTFYLSKIPGWAQRIRVALDWTADFFFPREVVELGLHKTRRDSSSRLGRGVETTLERPDAETDQESPGIDSISAITLATSDMARAMQFYQALGFKFLYGDEQSSFTSLTARFSYLNLIAHGPGHERTWWGRVIFYVPDVDALYRHAIAQGLHPETSPRDASWGERYFHITDPDGHELSFAKPL